MLVDRTITHQWWDELLNDDARMIAWLKKLQITELDGYASSFEANAKWNQLGNLKVEKFLVKTAKDELKHSNMLIGLLRERGHHIKPGAAPTSSLYWDEMDKAIDSLETCCAVFYFGEQLATERFQVIYDHRDTPDDIAWFIEQALPDETYHAHGFRSLAGDEAINKMLAHHNAVMQKLLSKRT